MRGRGIKYVVSYKFAMERKLARLGFRKAREEYGCYLNFMKNQIFELAGQLAAFFFCIHLHSFFVLINLLYPPVNKVSGC